MEPTSPPRGLKDALNFDMADDSSVFLLSAKAFCTALSAASMLVSSARTLDTIAEMHSGRCAPSITASTFLTSAWAVVAALWQAVLRLAQLSLTSVAAGVSLAIAGPRNPV